MRFYLMICFVVFVAGCQPPLVRGSSSKTAPRGLLYTLNYTAPLKQVRVAFVFPFTVDLEATYDGTGRTSLSLDEAKWQVVQTVRFEGKRSTSVDISFNYDAGTSTFVFRKKWYDVKVNQIVVIRFDTDYAYEVEIVPMNDANTNEILTEMGRSTDASESETSQPSTD